MLVSVYRRWDNLFFTKFKFRDTVGDLRFIFSIMHGMIHSHIIIVLHQLLPYEIAIVDENIDELLTTDVLFNCMLIEIQNKDVWEQFNSASTTEELKAIHLENMQYLRNNTKYLDFKQDADIVTYVNCQVAASQNISQIVVFISNGDSRPMLNNDNPNTLGSPLSDSTTGRGIDSDRSLKSFKFDNVDNTADDEKNKEKEKEKVQTVGDQNLGAGSSGDGTNGTIHVQFAVSSPDMSLDMALIESEMLNHQLMIVKVNVLIVINWHLYQHLQGVHQKQKQQQQIKVVVTSIVKHEKKERK